MSKVVFFGQSIIILKALHSAFEILSVYTENDRVTPELTEYCKKYGLLLKPIISIEEISTENAIVGISFGFGLIFKKTFLTNCCPILNIHPGSLKTNRGRHPLHWDIFLDAMSCFVSVHRIGPGIDEGELIDEFTFKRDQTSTLLELEGQVENISSQYIVSAVHNFLESQTKFPKILGGTYRKKFDPSLFQDLKSLTSEQISALFLIQKKYGGLKIGTKVYSEVRLVEPGFLRETADWETIESLDGKKMILKLLKEENGRK